MVSMAMSLEASEKWGHIDNPQSNTYHTVKISAIRFSPFLRPSLNVIDVFMRNRYVS